MDACDACDLARERIQADMVEATARVTQRAELESVGYDGFGSPLYAHQVGE